MSLVKQWVRIETEDNHKYGYVQGEYDEDYYWVYFHNTIGGGSGDRILKEKCTPVTINYMGEVMDGRTMY